MNIKIKHYLSLLIISAIIVSCAKDEATPKVEGWTIETIDNSGSPTSINNILADQNSDIHVAYIDKNSTDKNKIKYAFRTSKSGWKNEFVDGDGDCEDFVSMAIDTITQKVYIAYVKTHQLMTSNSYDEHLILAEKSFGASIWTKTIVQGTLNNSGMPKLFVDKNQGVHIAYMRGGYGQTYHAYRPLNGIFNISLVSEEGGGTSSIVVDNNLKIHILFFASKNIKYATKTIGESEWQESTLINDITTSGETISMPMVLNENNLPEALIITNTTDDILKLGVCQQNWNISAFSTIVSFNEYSIDMFIQKSNRYITYKETTGLSGQHFDLRVAYSLNNNFWKTQIVDGDSDNRCGGYNSIYIENDGRVHISYTADTEKVLKYACKTKIE